MMRIIRSLLVACALFAGAFPAFAESLDINRASAAQLADAMTGVGPAKAEAIVAYRRDHGPFASVDDLTQVKGIGAKTVDGNRDAVFAGQSEAAR